jgi:hypothetical protein
MADEGNEVHPEIIIQPDQMAGVWANFAQVSHSPYEFTLDFVRLEFGPKPRGIVVARISVSPLFIDQLIQALQKNWELYAQKALPQEVYRGEDIRTNPVEEGGREASESPDRDLGDSGSDLDA